MNSQLENSRGETVGEKTNNGLRIQIISFESNKENLPSQIDTEEDCI